MSFKFKQCVACRPDGEQCRRTAQDGSNFCHSHRFSQQQPPQQQQPPTWMRYHKEIDSYTPHNSTLSICPDCGEAIQYPLKLNMADGNVIYLCTDCFDFRKKIETRILEIINAAPNHTLETNKIYEDLDTFGISKELTESARQRMYRAGILFSGDGRGVSR